MEPKQAPKETEQESRVFPFQRRKQAVGVWEAAWRVDRRDPEEYLQVSMPCPLLCDSGQLSLFELPSPNDQPCKVIGRTLGEMFSSCGAQCSCPEDGEQHNCHSSCHKAMQTHCWGERLVHRVSGKSVANVQKLFPSFGLAISLPCIYLEGTVKVYTENCG